MKIKKTIIIAFALLAVFMTIAFGYLVKMKIEHDNDFNHALDNVNIEEVVYTLE